MRELEALHHNRHRLELQRVNPLQPMRPSPHELRALLVTRGRDGMALLNARPA